MAQVTKTVVGDETTYTISSVYPMLAINMLMMFIRYNGNFCISQDNGATWSATLPLTEPNLRAISVNLEQGNIVCQFMYSAAQIQIAINNMDLLDINNNNDVLLGS